jgi:hypothetical protein
MLPGKSLFIRLPVSNVCHNSEKKSIISSVPMYDTPNSYVTGHQPINKLGSQYRSKILFEEDSALIFFLGAQNRESL